MRAPVAGPVRCTSDRTRSPRPDCPHEDDARLSRGRPIRLFLSFALALGFTALFASTPARSQADAFSVEVAISDRSDAQKQEAFTLAMRQVLLANSGDKTLLNRSDVRDAVRDAQSYVEQFRYRVPKPGTVIDRNTPVTDVVRQSGEATQLMLVRFDRERLDALIDADAADADQDAAQASAAAIADPTSALVWMLIEDGPRDILVTGDHVINVQRRAIEIAGGAGVSLRFPAGDELDVQAIDVEDLRILPALASDDRDFLREGSGKPGERNTSDGDLPSTGVPPDTDGSKPAEILTPVQRLERASERYAEPQVLIGHVQRQPLRGWKSAWQRIDMSRSPGNADTPGAGEPQSDLELVTEADRISETRFTTESLDSALQRGLGWLIPALDDSPGQAGDERFADVRSATESLVWIGSLDTTKSYAQTLQFLEGIEGVTTVYPKLASADGMIFSLSPRNALGNLNAALPGVNWLRPIAKPQVASRSRLGRDTELTLDYIGPIGN